MCSTFLVNETCPLMVIFVHFLCTLREVVIDTNTPMEVDFNTNTPMKVGINTNNLMAVGIDPNTVLSSIPYHHSL